MTGQENFIFAVNPRVLGGDLSKYHRGYAEPATAEQISAILADERLAGMNEDIRAGQVALKDKMPTMCPHYSAFRKNHRSQADIIPKAFTFKTCIDVDDKELVELAIERAMELNQDESSDWQDMVQYIEYSPRKKVHIWLLMPKGMTIEETQRAFCKEIDVPYDESCTTPERFINMTGDVIYKSDSWLQPLSAEELEERREEFLNRGLDVDGQPLLMPERVEPPVVKVGKKEANARTRYIFKECMVEAGLQPYDLVKEGGRHNALKCILSVGATQLLTKEELMGVLSEMMPSNWQDSNIQKLVGDFYGKYTDTSQKMTIFQRRVFARSLRMETNDETKEDTKTKPETAQKRTAEPQSPLARLYASSTPPPMPERLPRLLALLTSKVPDFYKPTVAMNVLPPLAVHLNQVPFLYTDNTWHEARLNCMTMAPTGSGKSCINEPIAHIMADIRNRDEDNQRRLNEFNTAFSSTKSTKDKPVRPEGLVIQEVNPDCTGAAFVQRMQEAEGRFLYLQANEIEQLFAMQNGRGAISIHTIMELADDPQNRYGQTRAGKESVNANVCVKFNYNVSGTINKVQQFFSKKLIDGPLSRVTFATIPEREIGAPMPVFGFYDAAFDKKLRPFINNLNNASGKKVCKQAQQLAKRLEAECTEFAQLSQDRVFENLSFRARVHAFLRACVLNVASGKWEKAIEDWVVWSLRYDLFLKMRYFADGIRQADGQIKTSKRGPQSLLELIPVDEEGVFTYRDAVRIRIQEGKGEEGTANMLDQWVHRGYIERLQMTDDSFKKKLR